MNAKQFGLTLVAIGIGMVLAMLLTARAPAQTQDRRLYDDRGRNVGTISTDSAGNERFRDAKGRSVGTSSTDSQGTTTFYDARGHVVGKAR
jgi:YD repeat-containing protein